MKELDINKLVRERDSLKQKLKDTYELMKLATDQAEKYRLLCDIGRLDTEIFTINKRNHDSTKTTNTQPDTRRHDS